MAITFFNSLSKFFIWFLIESLTCVYFFFFFSSCLGFGLGGLDGDLFGLFIFLPQVDSGLWWHMDSPGSGLSLNVYEMTHFIWSKSLHIYSTSSDFFSSWEVRTFLSLRQHGVWQVSSDSFSVGIFFHIFFKGSAAIVTCQSLKEISIRSSATEYDSSSCQQSGHIWVDQEASRRHSSQYRWLHPFTHTGLSYADTQIEHCKDSSSSQTFHTKFLRAS